MLYKPTGRYDRLISSDIGSNSLDDGIHVFELLVMFLDFKESQLVC